MKNKKMNNKGFSLVELIIVVAIMAILIVVLAPQYLKFVERSRKSTDRTNVDEIIRAVEIYSADPEATETPAAGKIVVSTTSKSVADATDSAFLEDALKEAGITNVVLKSKEWYNAAGTKLTQIEIDFTVTDGVVSATVDAYDSKESDKKNILD